MSIVDEIGPSASLETFHESLPYLEPEFSSRSWGHPLHSLCSYQGKLKPAMAHALVGAVVPSDASILDPLGGVGTVPFEAALTGRASFSNDLSPLAFTVARAKLDPPTLEDFEEALDQFTEDLARIQLTSSDRAAADFGLNARVRDYYHPETLDEVLRARSLFARDVEQPQPRAFIWACLLHVLHGNRPYALSRRSHPITPFSPSGPFERRSLVAAVKAKAERALATPLPVSFKPGRAVHGDYSNLADELAGKVDAIITSPPFIGMRFDRPNWLRLWFCGWEAETFHATLAAGFLERQQTRSRECYRPFFAMCAELLNRGAPLILHVGSGARGDLAADLRREAQGFSLQDDVIEDVTHLERHGLPDKRLTKQQHLLLFDRL